MKHEAQNIENYSNTQDTKDYFGTPLPSPLPWALISGSAAALSLTLAFMMVNASPKTPQALVLQGTILSFLTGGLAFAGAALALQTSQKNKKRRGLVQQGEPVPPQLLNKEEVYMITETLTEIAEGHFTEINLHLEESISQEHSVADISQPDGTTISVCEKIKELLSEDMVFVIETLARFISDGHFDFEEYSEELERRRDTYKDIIASTNVRNWDEPSP